MTARERIERLSVPEPNTGCWLWLGAVSGEQHLRQYGRLIVGSRRDGSRRSTAAHRYSYQIFNGAIPKGFEVCRSCDTPACVNPLHLFVGTRLDNIRDRENKGRNVPPRVLYGEDHHRAKLTQTAIAVIRSSGLSDKDLAAQFGVSRRTISDARREKTWAKKLPDPPKVESQE